MSAFHIRQIKRGELKALQIINDRNRKWWIHFAICMSEIPTPPEDKLPPAVLGRIYEVITPLQDKKGSELN